MNICRERKSGWKKKKKKKNNNNSYDRFSKNENSKFLIGFGFWNKIKKNQEIQFRIWHCNEAICLLKNVCLNASQKCPIITPSNQRTTTVNSTWSCIQVEILFQYGDTKTSNFTFLELFIFRRINSNKMPANRWMKSRK